MVYSFSECLQTSESARRGRAARYLTYLEGGGGMERLELEVTADASCTMRTVLG